MCVSRDSSICFFVEAAPFSPEAALDEDEPTAEQIAEAQPRKRVGLIDPLHALGIES